MLGVSGFGTTVQFVEEDSKLPLRRTSEGIGGPMVEVVRVAEGVVVVGRMEGSMVVGGSGTVVVVLSGIGGWTAVERGGATGVVVGSGIGSWVVTGVVVVPGIGG